MELAANFSHPTASLIEEGRILLDYFKCPAGLIWSRDHSPVLRLLILLTMLVVLAGCAAPPEAGVSFEIVAGKPDATVNARAEGGIWLIEVFSKSGIGSATVRAISATSPTRVILRFHLQGLEELRFKYGPSTVTVALASSGDNAVRETILTGDSATDEEAIAQGSPYWMPVRLVPLGAAEARIPLTAGYIELEAPADFLAGRAPLPAGRGPAAAEAGSFSVTWVDFFR